MYILLCGLYKNDDGSKNDAKNYPLCCGVIKQNSVEITLC